MVCPSTLEAFGQVAFEAGACETPSIAFKNTGFEDVIEHMQTGYLAKYKNQDDITFGINWVLENNKNNILGEAARELISKKFSYEKISEEYIESKIEERIKAKNNGNYDIADKIREELLNAGILIEDEKGKTKWRYK